MKIISKYFQLSFACLALAWSSFSLAADSYKIDVEGDHAFINFRVQHLGYSWLWGRFNEFSGEFSYDEDSATLSDVRVEIETDSVDTNHERRDKHLRSGDFLEVKKFPEASFVSMGYEPNGGGSNSGTLYGNLTLRGVSKEVALAVTEIGAGKDPWGGYRRGFEATTSITMADFGITTNLGPKSKDVEFIISIEGIRQ